MTRVDPSHAGADRDDLASALQGLRRAAGLTGERLAVRCGMSQSKVSRIETGRLLPTVIDVQLILNALGVDPETRDVVLDLAKVANAEYEDVREWVRRGLDHRQRDLQALETGAAHVRHFLPTLVTGLLQIPEYMRVALMPPAGLVGGDVSAALVTKLKRQEVLHDRSKRFEFILTEFAIRWRLTSPSVMAMQIDRLISVSRMPNVRLGVLPLDARITDGPYHTFVVYDDALVTVELFSGQIVLRTKRDVDHYAELFEFFGGHALYQNDARARLNEWADEFRAES